MAAWFTEGWPAPLVLLLWAAWVALAFGPTVVLVLGIDAVRRRAGFARACSRVGLLAGTVAGPLSVGVMIVLSSDREFVGMALALMGPPLLLFQALVLLVPWLLLRARLRRFEREGGEDGSRPEGPEGSASRPGVR